MNLFNRVIGIAAAMVLGFQAVGADSSDLFLRCTYEVESMNDRSGCTGTICQNSETGKCNSTANCLYDMVIKFLTAKADKCGAGFKAERIPKCPKADELRFIPSDPKNPTVAQPEKIKVEYDCRSITDTRVCNEEARKVCGEKGLMTDRELGKEFEILVPITCVAKDPPPSP